MVPSHIGATSATTVVAAIGFGEAMRLVRSEQLLRPFEDCRRDGQWEAGSRILMAGIGSKQQGEMTCVFFFLLGLGYQQQGRQIGRGQRLLNH